MYRYKNIKYLTLKLTETLNTYTYVLYSSTPHLNLLLNHLVYKIDNKYDLIVYLFGTEKYDFNDTILQCFFKL